MQLTIWNAGSIILQSLKHFPKNKVGAESGPTDGSEDDEQVLCD